MTELSERAILVTLHISSWSGMMVDREITDDVNESYKASKEAGRYNKRLVASSFFKEISLAHNHARTAHRVLTLPWEDDGTRILATAGFMAYQEKMRDCKRKAEAAVKGFLETPDPYITEAKQRLASMFNIEDYPDADTLKSKFGFDVEVRALPDAADFRAKLDEKQVAAVVKDIERRTNDRLETAMNDVFKRIAAVVEHMSKRLKEYVPPKEGNKAEGLIRDSVVYNIHELASEVLPLLNVTNDPRITTLQQQLLSELVEHSPEILRADSKVRLATATKADKLLKKVQGYMK